MLLFLAKIGLNHIGDHFWMKLQNRTWAVKN